jgi:hypothetical protein
VSYRFVSPKLRLACIFNDFIKLMAVLRLAIILPARFFLMAIEFKASDRTGFCGWLETKDLT